MYAVAKKNIFAKSHHQPGAPRYGTETGNGECQPPRNRIGARNETRIMFAYSVRKNTANGAPEYSTWKPATISYSPSAPSNGARFVSATPETKYTMNIGSSGSQNQSRS